MLCQILLRFSVSVSVSVSISICLSSVQTAAAFTTRTPIPSHDATPDSAWLRGGRNDLEDGLFDGAVFGHLDLQLHHIPTRGSTHKPCAASGTGMRARRCDKSAGERASERVFAALVGVGQRLPQPGQQGVACRTKGGTLPVPTSFAFLSRAPTFLGLS